MLNRAGNKILPQRYGVHKKNKIEALWLIQKIIEDKIEAYGIDSNMKMEKDL